MYKSLIKVALLGLVIDCFVSFSQIKTVNMPVTGGGTLTACSAKVYDGGGKGNYTINNNGYLTIYPEVAGNYITLKLDTCLLANSSDYLAIYDGTSTSAKLIGKYATPKNEILCATNASGALTLSFYSSSKGVSDGFVATVSCVSNYIKPDLSAVLQSNSLLTSGSSVDFSLEIDNSKNLISKDPIAYADVNKVSIYLSGDPSTSINETADVKLWEYYVPTILGNGSFSIYTKLNLPNTFLGVYYLKVYVDSDNQISEAIESNNIYVKEVKILATAKFPDYAISEVKTILPIVVKGSSLNVSTKIHNKGFDYGLSYDLEYFLSNDAMWDSKDISLGKSSIFGPLASDSLINTKELLLPSNLTYGAYFLIAIVNGNSTVQELNNDNNSSVFKFSYIPPAMDLQIKRVTSPKIFPLFNTSAFNIKVEEENPGMIMADQHYVGVYLSKDSVWDSKDVFLNAATVNSISAKQIISHSISASLGSNTAIGEYYLIAVVDHTKYISEINENNNSKALKIEVVANTRDLTLNGFTVSSSACVAGNMISGIAYEYNKGNTYTSNYEFGCYLSKDTLWDASDVLLAEKKLLSIDGNVSQTTSFNIPVPTNTIGGEYYLILKEDHNNKIVEINENNNTRWVMLSINAFDADLKPSVMSLKNQDGSALKLERGFDVVLEEMNLGKHTAPSHRLGVFLSKDSIYQTGDSLLKYVTVNLLDSGMSYAANLGVTINKAIVGNYCLLAVSDYDQMIPESIETNNVKVLKVTLVDPTKDLAIQNLTGFPPNLVQGNNWTASAVILNTSEVVISGFDMAYFLSTDSVYGKDDLLLGRFNNTSVIAKDVQLTLNHSLSVPVSLPLGNYYVIGLLDDLNKIKELNKTNNTKVLAVKVLPAFNDLTVAYIGKGSLVCGQGQSLVCQLQENNIGTVTASPHTLNLYLSRDTLIGAEDIKVGTSSISYLSGKVQLSISIVIPNSVVTGNYELIALADGNNEVIESSETNNNTYQHISIVAPIPDMTTKDPYVVHKTAAKGGPLSAILTFANIGYGYSNNFTIEYFLSKDSIYDAQDVSLYQEMASSLPPLGTRVVSQSLTVPSTVDTGKYYLIVILDRSNSISESTEANNVKAFPLIIELPVNNLMLSKLVGNVSSLKAGSNIKTTYTIKNVGNQVSSQCELYFCLSKDSIYDVGDQQITGSLTILGLARDGVYESNVNVTIPSSVSGDYYLLGRINYTKDMLPIDNYKAIPIQVLAIKPDLQVSQLKDVASSSWITGETRKITGLVTNMGEASVSNSYVSYYLSIDSSYSGEDILLTSVETSSIYSGQTLSKEVSFKIPETIKAGNYYIIAIADFNNSVSESVETNNTKALPIYIETAWVDLQPISFEVPIWAEQRSAIYPKYKVKNWGNIAVPINYYGFYASLDSIWDVNDALMYNFAVNQSILPGTELNTDDGVYIPYTIPSGYYYIIAVSDPENKIAESNEKNNTKALRMFINKRDSDLKMDSISIPSTELNVGGEIKLSIKVENEGITPVYKTEVQVYLSVDSVYQSTDTFIGKLNYDLIKAGDGMTVSNRLNLSYKTSIGKYNLLYILDKDNQIGETNEANNLYIQPVSVKASKADLQITSTTLSNYYVQSGNSVTAKVVASNTSMQGVYENYYIGIYLSVDSLFGANDILLKQWLPSLYSPASSNQLTSADFTIPNLGYTTNTCFYILVRVDDKNDIAENNEVNNTKVTRIVIGSPAPDLSISGINLKNSQIVVNQFLQFNYKEINQGPVLAPAHTNAIYLSYDNKMSYDDLLLRRVTSNSIIATTGVQTLADSIFIPNGILSGRYYLVVVADEPSAITEGDEYNNSIGVPFEILSLNTDLGLIKPLLAVSTVEAGNKINVEVQFINLSINRAGSHFDGFLLSKDTLMDASDSLLNYTYTSVLEANGSQSLNVSLPISSATAIGDYYILAVADYFKMVNESNELNNVKATRFGISKVTVIGKDEIEAGNLFLYPNPSTGKVQILGGAHGSLDAEVYDVNGRLVYEEKGVNQNIHLESLTEGVYVVRLNGNNFIYTTRLILVK